MNNNQNNKCLMYSAVTVSHDCIW